MNTKDILKAWGNEWTIAFIVSVAIIVAILSMPEVLTPLAKYVLTRMESLIPLAVFVIGIVHGLKPDEHTWPITISYALMQRDPMRVVLSTLTFTGALTLVWTILSALIGYVERLGLTGGIYDPGIDAVVGITMIGVALAYIYSERKHSAYRRSGESAPDYKLIWIHGLAAAFGGDFFVVLILTLAIAPLNALPTYAVGLLFGLGSLAGQLPVVLLAYRGIADFVRNPSLLVRVGRLSLLILGTFMVMLGITQAILSIG